MGAPTLQAAYVLHSRRYGDSSLLVEILTRTQGRLACIAKGALRSARSETRIQAFQPLLIELRGRGEVLTLARAEAGGALQHLTGRRLYCGLYLNELLLKLTARQDPCTGLFDDYERALRDLPTASSAEPVLRRFEVRLLEHLGLGLALERDTHGQPIQADSRYTYDLDSGPNPSLGTGSAVISGATLLALRQGDFADGESLRQARMLMRRILDHHLDGRPLRSRELFR